MMRERAKGKTQDQAAARAGMSVRTARSYEQAERLPSQGKKPRTHRTRTDPFAEDWPWIEQQLQRDPALQGTTLFGVLCAQHPNRYRESQSHGLTHMLLNVGALVIFIINAIIHTGNWTHPSGTGSGLFLALVGVLLTVGAGFFGWTMIQNDHVGVELSPEQERLEGGAARL